MSTEDVDVARQLTIKLATPIQSGGFMELLERTGLKFVPIHGLERSPGPATSYSAVATRLRVDLLVPAPNSHAFDFRATEVPELGSHATELPYLRYLLQDPFESLVIGRDEVIPVTVPQPAKYCLHKLGVAALRPSAETTKISKDVFQCAVLATILSLEGREDELSDAAAQMPRGLLQKAAKTIPAATAMLSADYPGVAHLLANLFIAAES